MVFYSLEFHELMHTVASKIESRQILKGTPLRHAHRFCCITVQFEGVMTKVVSFSADSSTECQQEGQRGQVVGSGGVFKVRALVSPYFYKNE